MEKELRLIHNSKNMVISYAHFTRIWKTHLPEYTISVTSDFTKCSTCTELSAAFQKAQTDNILQRIAELKQQHDSLDENERVAYHEARQTAVSTHGR
ncbi:hypothetical protein HOLleu_18439 [Holothuria leucospilota]|uniref:Uncharacterized protein n=1 Tax=Holothuria leucospilota TaxID=206669 RepID=A0A9Q1H9F9_HOLLE|nr:hypothetical protein HOLleu_18439 [Holothuria leucospilota]